MEFLENNKKSMTKMDELIDIVGENNNLLWKTELKSVPHKWYWFEMINILKKILVIDWKRFFIIIRMINSKFKGLRTTHINLENKYIFQIIISFKN